MPGKPTVAATYKKALIRIPPDILERLQGEALKEERSVNGQIVYVLRTWCQDKDHQEFLQLLPAMPEGA